MKAALNNRAIMQSGPFENEIGAGVLQSSVQQACMPQECHRGAQSVGHLLCYDSVLLETCNTFICEKVCFVCI